MRNKITLNRLFSVVNNTIFKRTLGNAASSTMVNFHIKALDDQSFCAFVERNREQIKLMFKGGSHIQ